MFRQVFSLFTLYIASISASPTAIAVVITDDAVMSPPPNQALYLSKSIPDGQGLFGISFTELDSSLVQLGEYTIAEATGLYAVEDGDHFGLDYATTVEPIVSSSLSLTSNTIPFELLETKVFGYWDDRNFSFDPSENDNYGWVRITRTLTGFVVTEGATAIGRGIIVGTLTQIPEPSVAFIATSSLLSFMVTRRCRRAPPLA